jgi:DNA gyrase subunit B
VIYVITPRDFGAELDLLTIQLDELKQLVSQITNTSPSQVYRAKRGGLNKESDNKTNTDDELGAIFYSGQYRGKNRYRWDPQQRSVSQLLDLDSDKVAKVLAALGNKQRLDILKAVLKEPLTGSEIVEQLNMGTTGQLYHHTKALLGADLLIQEDRGGKYSLPPQRSLPLLLLLAASSDLLDTSDYMELAETRNNAGAYLGNSQDEYDPHHLLWSVIENSIVEHQAGYCSEVNLILQNDGSITVADNGRGIPIQALQNTHKTNVQAVLTEISNYSSTASVVAPGGVKGINMPVVNALSQQLSVEIRREGKVFRQDYKHGIPQTELLVIGVTRETGTSITFIPDQDIFGTRFNKNVLENRVTELTSHFPALKIHIFN